MWAVSLVVADDYVNDEGFKSRASKRKLKDHSLVFDEWIVNKKVLMVNMNEWDVNRMSLRRRFFDEQWMKWNLLNLVFC